MLRNNKVPEKLLIEIKHEVWNSLERSLKRISKKYSTNEYEMVIGFDKSGITAERAWL